MNDYISLLAKLNPGLISQDNLDTRYIQTIQANYNEILMISAGILDDVHNIKKKSKTQNIDTDFTVLIDVLKKTKSDIGFQKKEKEMWFLLGKIQPQAYNSIINVLNDYNNKFEDVIEKMEKIN